MKQPLDLNLNYIYIGDVLERLKLIPSAFVRCCITSPPYWGQRDYGTASWIGGDPDCDHSRSKNIQKDISTAKSGQQNGYAAKRVERNQCKKCGAIRSDKQIGLESSPEDYIKKMVAVFTEIHRILTPDGTLWVNIGDSYFGGKGAGGDANIQKQKERFLNGESFSKPHQSLGKKGETSPLQGRHPSLKPKDLAGVPWQLAFALAGRILVPGKTMATVADLLTEAIETTNWDLVSMVQHQLSEWSALSMHMNSFWLRQDIIWAKTTAMPESVTDRCTKASEYIFLFAKSANYYFDHVAIRQPIAESVIRDRRYNDPQYQIGRPERGHPEGHPTEGGGMLKRKSGNIARVASIDRGTPVGTGKNQAGNVPWEGDTANKRSVWHITPGGFEMESCGACHRFYLGHERTQIRTVKQTGDGKLHVKKFCICGRHDAWINHFATFPEEIPSLCIQAGTSQYGQCTTCSSPWVRMTEKELKPTYKASAGTEIDSRDLGADANHAGANRVKDGHKPGYHNHFITTGWRPSCECNGKLKKHFGLAPSQPIFNDLGEIIEYTRPQRRNWYEYLPGIPLADHPVSPDRVMDPFFGSGKTGVSAMKHGRKFLGIDLSAEYIHEIATPLIKKESGMFYTTPVIISDDSPQSTPYENSLRPGESILNETNGN